MNLNLAGKYAIVCGSTQGIGRATALELAASGAHLILIARDAEKLKKVVDELPQNEQQHHSSLTADFSRPDELKNALGHLLLQHPPVHILVNNTGGPPAGPASEAATGEFIEAFNHHVICNHILAQAVIPGMKREKYGRIINIISTSVKQPIPGLGVSNTIRAAVGNWAKTLAGELGPYGITVNNILPGATNTIRLQQIIAGKAKKSGLSVQEAEAEMLQEIPARRFADPAEIAAAAAFLASPAAAYINGINLPVDGGRTLSL